METSPTTAIPLQEEPLNAETPLEALGEPLTPTPLFYIRNHFDMPTIDAADWRVTIDGAVARTLGLSLDDLRGRTPRTLAVTLECAGNGRAHMTPVPPGVPWGYGAVGTARFTGLPLGPLLSEAGLQAHAVEVAFEGADEGYLDGQAVRYVRSLPVDVALAPDTLLAWEMNDEPLSAEHGFPLRLVVPRWYGMASVKWLRRITALRTPFAGHFQQEYVYADAPGARSVEPISLSRVRALIARPGDGEELPGEPVEIAGTAWSGAAPIRRVEVSADGGLSWARAELGPALSPVSARTWSTLWRPRNAGTYVLAARATDTAGNTQPLDPVQNVRGYGNNVVQRVSVSVR
jgi:DMSO/TMAO reductase YedYZ molybdopterin-dependent catalytic subunit